MSDPCGHPTNSPDGVCASCRIDRGYQEILNARGAQKQISKACPVCNIVATTPGQKTCRNCGAEFEEKDMAKCDTEGCNSPIIKDRLCYRCYKAKNGHAPYGPKSKKPATNILQRAAAQAGYKTADQDEKALTALLPPLTTQSCGIVIDLSPYPKTSKILSVLPSEVRGKVLSSMIADRLDAMEAVS